MLRSISLPCICMVILMVSSAMATSGYQLDIIESTDSYIIADITFDSLRIVQKQVDSRWLTDVQIDGFAFTDKEGQPRLPVTSLVLGIPVGAKPRLSVLSENRVTKSLGPIVPVEKQRLGVDSPAPDSSQTFPSSDWYPAKVAEIGLTGNLRDQRIVQLQLHPVRYHAPSGMARIVKSMRFRLDFDGVQQSQGYRQVSKLSPKDKFESIYSAGLNNYDQAKKWRRLRKSGPYRTAIESAEAPFRYKIYIRDDGVYSITGEQLQRQGVDLASIDPVTLALSNKGQAVPIIVEGWSDQSFDPEDRLIFIGEHNRGENSYYDYYSDTNVYILSWGAGPGARFAEISGIPSQNQTDTTNVVLDHVHLEYDVLYERLLLTPREDLDHWFWKLLSIGEEFPLRIPGDYIVPDRPMRIRVGLHGLTYVPAQPDHRVLLKVNEQIVGEARWDNQTPYELDTGFVMPKKIKQDNELKISLPGGLTDVGVDNVLLNWIDFDFYQELHAQNDFITFMDQDPGEAVLMVKGFKSARQPYLLSTAGYMIKNAQLVYNGSDYSLYFADQSQNKSRYYILTEDRFKSVPKIEKMKPPVLKNPSNGADYILITHPDFMDQANKLADFRSAQNLRTAVVNIYDIYDEFNYGLYSPLAIKRFVQYAYENWTKPAPLYLLLFGDTTHRMDKEIAHKTEFKTFVPSMMEYTYSWGMTSSDNFFVAVSGDDFLPDLFVGRLPINNSAEANIMVQKIIDYETKSIMGDWRRNVFLLSGNNSFFESSSQYLYDNIIPKRMVTNRLSTMVESPFFGSTEVMAKQFNDGQSIVNFIGHGGGGVYFDSQLFLTEDIDRLENKDKYPIAFSMTCFVGHFDNPDMASLAEELLRAPDKGIVAHFGSAGRAYLYGDFFLNNALFDAIYNQGARTIGEITTLGKLEMVQKTQGYFDHVKNYILLGDPAMRVSIIEDNIELNVSPQIVKSGDRVTVSGSVPGAVDGEIILSLFNQADSLLLIKETSLQSGKFSLEFFTMDPALLQNWPQGQGTGRVRVYFKNDRVDAASVGEFVVNQPLIPQVYTSPDSPSHLQDFYFTTVIDQSKYTNVGGIVSATLEWSVNSVEWYSLTLARAEGTIWQTTEAVQKPEGTTIYYRLHLSAGDGSQNTGQVHSFRIGYRPDLYVIPETITVSGSNKMLLSATIRNNGGRATGPFSVAAYEGKVVGEGTQISGDVTVDNLAPKSDTTLTLIWEGAAAGTHDLYFRVDPSNQVIESNESNNLTQRSLGIASAGEGTNGPYYSTAGRYYIEVTPGALAQNSVVGLQTVESEKFQTSARNLSLVPIPVDGAEKWSACQLQFGDSTLQAQKPVRVGIFVNKFDSLTANYLAEEYIKVYGWNAASNSWKGLATKTSAEQALLTSSLPAGYSIFAALASTDTQAPVIDISIAGQNFMDGDIVGRKPTVAIRVEDQSGIDIGDEPIKVFLDDQEFSAEQYVLFQEQGSKTKVTLTFAPELDSGEHHLHVTASDINGNISEADVSMSVAGEFGLAAIANHPNPFATETVIAFTLTDMAQEVNIGVYTVSGRLIRSFRYFDLSGYHEQEWDGRDQEGNEVANGAYYLKFSARSGDKKIERIEKMARLR